MRTVWWTLVSGVGLSRFLDTPWIGGFEAAIFRTMGIDRNSEIMGEGGGGRLQAVPVSQVLLSLSAPVAPFLSPWRCRWHLARCLVFRTEKTVCGKCFLLAHVLSLSLLVLSYRGCDGGWRVIIISGESDRLQGRLRKNLR